MIFKPLSALPFFTLFNWETMLCTVSVVTIVCTLVNHCGQMSASKILPPDPITQPILEHTQASLADSISLPPEREEFISPNQRYVLVLSTSDGWHSKRAIAELFEREADRRTLLWSRTLLHEYRPRYAIVGSQGNVLLLDEWINVKSRFAVVILSRDNHLVAQYNLDAVQEILDVPMSDIVQQATRGWWITAPPTLSSTRDRAYVETAGRHLVVDLQTGSLSVSAPSL